MIKLNRNIKGGKSMRKRYAILIICLSGILFPFRSFAQDEVFPTKDAIWNIYVYAYPETKNYYYGLIGDTVIYGQTYNKLYLLNDTLLQIDSKDIYVGGIRQSEKKVYMKPADKSSGVEFDEFLMYDFSLEAGDYLYVESRPYIFTDDQTITFENSNIEWSNTSIYVSGDFETPWGRCKEIGYPHLEPDYWIEGVGSLSGLFFLPERNLSRSIASSYNGLACLKVGNKIRYKYLDYKCCMGDPIENGVSKEFSSSILIQKLGYRQLLIQCPENGLPLQFELLNLSGQVVQSQTVRDSDTIIDLHVSVSGIYLYRLIGDKLYKSDKIVVR